RAAAAAAALDDSVTSPSRPLQVWRRHVDSARPGAVRWRLRSTDPRGWDPSVYGTLIVHGRQDGHGPKTRLKLSVEWRSPNLAGTTLAAPKMLVELPVDPASTRNSWRVDLLRSIAWALSDTITDLVVEVEGGVRVTQIRLAATGG
ncbi:MAG: hypothetical protein KC466_03185, partial [Myxococcales bacterium]|nr:hypothetical protein [Myxococcales bacterium]